MSSEDSFPQLLARVRAGDDAAAAIVFRRFVDQLAAKAHRHLAPAVRQRLDAEDVIQSVYRTFFRRVRQGEFQLDHWGCLWGLLTRITVRKCARAGGRGKNRPHQVSAMTDADSSADESTLDWEALAREPSPAEAAAFNDTLDILMKPLRESHREIVVLILRGHTQEEIGRQLGCSERTVRRVLVQVQANLQKLDRS
ncbi:MAG TPA: sigma-70 family RNA polymerase sigma factor [Planctomycetaceae bacterium]|nr:sigma-70 family RNA polymerase sigma factor [Planctomycetaceae bacterium]